MTGTQLRAVFLVLILLCNMLELTAWAQALSEEDKTTIKTKQTELDGIRDQMGDKRNEVNVKRERERTAYQELRVVERNLANAENELARLQRNINNLEQTIQNNEKYLKESVANMAGRQTAYNKRIRSIYMHGQVNYLDVLLGSKDFDDFTTRFQLLTHIVKSDVNLINQIKKERADVQKQQAQLLDARQRMSELRHESLAKRTLVAEHRQHRKTVFDEAAAERDRAEREYRALMTTSEQITNMIRRLESNGQPIGVGSGALIWPLRGQITSYYGSRVHPVLGGRRFHTGIDIHGQRGAPIKASDEGIVIKAGWLSGYGYTVILDHGAGIATLYAHCSQLMVMEGEKVLKGQTIALVGATGYATGPHCHFEVRVRGQTDNPISYLP